MKFVLYVLSVCVIVLCARVAQKLPSLGGLIAVMPLTGFAALMWLYVDGPDDFVKLSRYTSGALWGILPSILFYGAAYFCFRRRLPLWLVLNVSFGVWLAAAVVHQLLLRK